MQSTLGRVSKRFFPDFGMATYSDILSSKCAQFREQGKFIDVHLKVSEEVFSAHRIVLAASSDYFHAMFTHEMKESNQEVVELKDESISAATLKIVLDSIYSGDLQVNDENVLDVLVAADHLQVTSVVRFPKRAPKTQGSRARSPGKSF